MKLYNLLRSATTAAQHIALTLLIILGAVSTSQASVVKLPDEVLHYKVYYKWGLIQKQAGTAKLSLRSTPKGYIATLIGTSDPWADRIYSLRDTLHSNMSHDDMLPTRYERIAHEKGKYAHDVVEFERQGNTFIGHARRERKGADKDSQMRYASTELKAEGATVDLLSAYYYLRTLDFPTLKPGYTLTLNIFSGKQQEILKITYKGQERVKIQDVNHLAYHVEFTFTSDGKKKSSSNINAWISADTRRIPLKLEGSLPIGKVQCIYTHGQ